MLHSLKHKASDKIWSGQMSNYLSLVFLFRRRWEAVRTTATSRTIPSEVPISSHVLKPLWRSGVLGTSCCDMFTAGFAVIGGGWICPKWRQKGTIWQRVRGDGKNCTKMIVRYSWILLKVKTIIKTYIFLPKFRELSDLFSTKKMYWLMY